jgi:hypothetical protein
LILCPITFSQIQSTKAAQTTNPKFPLINKVLNGIGGIVGFFIGPIISFAEGYKVSPSNITIGYNEKVTVRVGNINLSTGQFQPPKNWFFFTERYVTFSAEFPGGNPGGVWFVNFNPPLAIQKPGELLITNATISLSSPPFASEMIQSTSLRIKVADTWVVNNLWYPEDRSYWPGGSNHTKPFQVIAWFFGAFTQGYGKWSGKVLTNYYYVNVSVKVKPYHAAKIYAVPPGTLTPNEIISIPVMVENQGNYNDTFNFRVKSDRGYPLTLINNGTITLQSGEQGQVFVGVAAPGDIVDTGTLHSLIIDVFSADQPNVTIGTQRLMLETQGLYVSEQISAYSIGIAFFIILVLSLVLTWRRRVNQQISIAPVKPWKIPEEQQHLAELKQTDRNAYEQERLMMVDEHKSALLWYEGYRKSLRKKPTTEKPEQKQKEKPKKPLSTFFKEPEKPPQGEQKKVQPSIPAKDAAKEKALAKIKNEQDKQLKKLKK